MGAKKGNSNWKYRVTHGTNKKFDTPEDMLIEINGYFEHVEENPLRMHNVMNSKTGAKDVFIEKPRPFTIQGLCNYLDITVKTFENYGTISARAEEKLQDLSLNKEEVKYYEEEKKLGDGFLQVITRTREVIYSQKYEGAVTGFFKENIIIRDLSLLDQKKVEVVTEQPLFPDAHKEDKNG